MGIWKGECVPLPSAPLVLSAKTLSVPSRYSALVLAHWQVTHHKKFLAFAPEHSLLISTVNYPAPKGTGLDPRSFTP
jgi:hypothetical protein